MRKLILLALIALLGCEVKEEVKQFDVLVKVDGWVSYKIYFPNLPETETNPLYLVRTENIWDYQHTVTVICASPLVVKAYHLGQDEEIKIYLYENNRLIKADSASGKLAEVWIEYAW